MLTLPLNYQRQVKLTQTEQAEQLETELGTAQPQLVIMKSRGYCGIQIVCLKNTSSLDTTTLSWFTP